MDISGGSAIITGGAGGFGGATARRLAKLGASVVIADVGEERGKALAHEIGNGAVFVPTDIMDEASLENAADVAVRIAPLRVAVVAHGGPPSPAKAGLLLDPEGKRLATAHFAHTIQVYLTSAFTVSAIAAEHMARNAPLANGQRGLIINTGSIAAYETGPGSLAYGASKGGITTMALVLARELAPYQIRSMVIAPGNFRTFAYETAGIDLEKYAARLAERALSPQRMGEPDEYAMLAQQIVENDYLNGTTIRLDAGARL
jgi:NAD(P)-dependent dehydrogenase (short-subunit alcohol dehydrogenase family)